LVGQGNSRFLGEAPRLSQNVFVEREIPTGQIFWRLPTGLLDRHAIVFELKADDPRQRLAAIAAAQYPAKGYVGSCLNGELPPESLRHFTRAAGFSLLRDLAAAPPVATTFAIAGLVGSETQVQQLGLWAVNWILPRELVFSRTIIEPRLSWLLDAYPGRCRLKAVLRTGPGPSWLIQSHGRGLSGEDSSYRRDSRIEMVFSTAPTAEFLDLCRTLLRDAAFVR
jgi:hypothetical protein